MALEIDFHASPAEYDDELLERTDLTEVAGDFMRAVSILATNPSDGTLFSYKDFEDIAKKYDAKNQLNQDIQTATLDFFESIPSHPLVLETIKKTAHQTFLLYQEGVRFKQFLGIGAYENDATCYVPPADPEKTSYEIQSTDDGSLLLKVFRDYEYISRISKDQSYFEKIFSERSCNIMFIQLDSFDFSRPFNAWSDKKQEIALIKINEGYIIIDRRNPDVTYRYRYGNIGIDEDKTPKDVTILEKVFQSSIEEYSHPFKLAIPRVKDPTEAEDIDLFIQDFLDYFPNPVVSEASTYKISLKPEIPESIKNAKTLKELHTALSDLKLTLIDAIKQYTHIESIFQHFRIEPEMEAVFAEKIRDYLTSTIEEHDRELVEPMITSFHSAQLNKELYSIQRDLVLTEIQDTIEDIALIFGTFYGKAPSTPLRDYSEIELLISSILKYNKDLLDIIEPLEQTDMTFNLVFFMEKVIKFIRDDFIPLLEGISENQAMTKFLEEMNQSETMTELLSGNSITIGSIMDMLNMLTISLEEKAEGMKEYYMAPSPVTIAPRAGMSP